MSQARESQLLAHVWVSDLFLRARIEGLAHEAGLRVRFFATPDALAHADEVPALAVIDLGDRAGVGLAAVEALAKLPGAPPVLAFYPHVEVALRDRALALGARRAVPRSQFMTRFGALAREVIAAP